MRSRFVNGMLIGGLVGILASLYYGSQIKESPRRYLMGRTRRIGNKTRRFVSDMAQDVQDFIRK